MTATIAVPASTTAAALQTSLSSKLATAATASIALGVTVEEVPTVAIASPADPDEDPAGTKDDEAGFPFAAIGGIVGGGGALLLLAAAGGAVLCRRRVLPPRELTMHSCITSSSVTRTASLRRVRARLAHSVSEHV